MARVAIDITGRTAGYDRALNRAERNTRSATRNIRRQFGTVAGAAGRAARSLALIGGTTALAGLAAGGVIVNRTIQRLDRLDKAARNAGVGLRTLQTFQVIGDLGGAQLEAVNIGLQRFNRRVGEIQRTGSGQLLKTFNELNISIRDIEGNLRPTEDLLEEFGRALASVEDPARRTSLAFSAFDTEGVSFGLALADVGDQIPAIRRRLEGLGLVLDREVVDAAVRAKDELTILGTVISRNLDAAVGRFLPTITTLTGALIDLASGAGGSVQNTIDNFLASQGGPEQLAVTIARVLADFSANLRISFVEIGNTLRTFGANMITVFNSVLMALERIPGVDLTGGLRRELESVERAIAQIQSIEGETIIGGTGDIPELINRSDELNRLNRLRADLTQRIAAGEDSITGTLSRQAMELRGQVLTEEQISALREQYGAQADSIVAAVQRQADAQRMLREEEERRAELLSRFGFLQGLGGGGQQEVPDVRNIPVFGAIVGAQEQLQRIPGIFRELGEDSEEGASRILTISDALAVFSDGLPTIGERVLGFADSMQSGLADAFERGDFSEVGDTLVNNVRRQLAESAANQLTEAFLSLATRAIQGIRGAGGGGGLGGLLGGIGSLFGGFRQHGGPVSAGRSYVVGEAGPELFRPRSDGAIIPNSGLSFGDINIDLSGTPMRSVSDVERAVLQPRILGAMFKEAQRRGLVRR